MDKISLFLRQIFAQFIVIIAQVFHIGINLYTVFQIQLAVALYAKNLTVYQILQTLDFLIS